MATRKNRNTRRVEREKAIENKRLRNGILGVFLMLFAVIFTTALIYHNPNDNTFLTVSPYPIENIFGTFGAHLSEIALQSFGLLAHFVALLCFVWGINYLSGKIRYIRHRVLTFLIFAILGAVVFNVTSAYSTIEKLLHRFSMDFYAGGFIGYILSKWIFIDMLHQANTACQWVYATLSVIWLLVAKRALFVEFDVIFNNIPKLTRKLALVVPNIPKLKRAKTSDNIEKNNDTKSDEDPNETSNDIPKFNFETGVYTLPNVELLDKHSEKDWKQDEGKISLMSAELLNVLEEFGVNGEILNVRQGPVVTMFEFRPAPGIKTSRVISLSDDIARSMSAISARISTIPGQNAIGIELPNKNRHTVYLKELLLSDEFKRMTSGIPIVLGKDISGNPVMADLAKMPHLLVAGTTGSGKSVSINDMILSILFKLTPQDCKLIMIDPKMLELSVYDEIPHLLTPVVTDPKKAVFALKWAVAEMENRYRQMSQLGVRNIDGFNKKIIESKENSDLLVRKIQTGFDQETGRPIFENQQLEFTPLPYIVIIVDEMADLMLVAGKDVEAAIQRLAQMARAAGIHLIMATQRPSVDVITGTIKANFPTRISFQVTSKIDSRTILGEQGAEQLLGQGDMLYMSGAGRILRVHGPFVKDSEVERIVNFIKEQGEPDYVDVVSEQFGEDDISGNDDSGGDDMYKKAIEIVMNDRKCSISYLQRKLQIGYNRAARIVEEMEQKGVLSAPNHTGKREILI
ncbi:MAG: DNA translocase FtsK 4TM domain-containing protein [Alphaproteobacteria bacterium]|nr:DNA translocase FtsK 4TM domain-containing protein [Alphaproteobacteria bacterium]